MTKPCPTCGKPVDWDDAPERPFCSERCRIMDLGRWASEDYRVDTGEDPDAGLGEEGPPEDFQPS